MIVNSPDKENLGMQAARPSEDMSITVNGQSRVPPGFRFHPTEEELLSYYLRKKVACEKIDLDVIRDVDLNKLEPWDIQEKCRIGSTPQNDWYFFSHKDKKYPTGTRTNRATAAGFWKATGRDKVIYTSCRRIGMRKTLVFYKGRAPHGQKSDWIMHEYRLDDHLTGCGGGQHEGQLQVPGGSDSSSCLPNVYGISGGDTISDQLLAAQEEGWVVCRVFKKKNYNKDVDSPKASSTSSVTNTTTTVSANDVKQLRGPTSSNGVDGRSLDQILQYKGKSCKQEAGAGSSCSWAANSVNYSSCCSGNQNVNNNSTSSTHVTGTARASSIMRYSIPFDTGLLDSRFMKLPPLESPTSLNPSCCGFTQVDHQLSATLMPCCSQPLMSNYNHPPPLAPSDDSTMQVGPTNHRLDSSNCQTNSVDTAAGVSDWILLDRLVASHLNGQSDGSCFDEDDDPNFPFSAIPANRLMSSVPGDMDLWTFAVGRTSSSWGSDGQLD